MGRGEVLTVASSSVGHQSHSLQRIGRHATFMCKKMQTHKRQEPSLPGVVVGAAVVVDWGEVVTAANGEHSLSTLT